MKIDVDKRRIYQLQNQNLFSTTDAGQKILLDHIGLYSNDYFTPHLSLQAQVREFEPEFLFNDLNHAFTDLRIRLFRGTIFVIHRKNLKTRMSAAKIFFDSILRPN